MNVSARGSVATKRGAGAARGKREPPGVPAFSVSGYATSCIAAWTCSVVTDFALAMAAAKRA